MRTFEELQLQVADESAFCELADTFTYALPIIGPPNVSYVSGRATDRSAQPRLFETRPGYIMPQSGGTLEFTVYAGGAGLDTASGALAEDWLHNLLSDGLGGGNLAGVGGVAGASASATAITNATGTRVRGGIVCVGEAGDELAEGQAAVVGNPDTALLTALPAAPGPADVVRSCLVTYPAQELGATKRFLVRHSTDDDAQYAFHGCQLESITFTVAIGELAEITFRYRYAYWRPVSALAVKTVETCAALPSTAGSVFWQAQGTATRVTEPLTELELTINLGLISIPGFGGAPQQSIVGYVRGKTSPEDPAGTLRIMSPHGTARRTEYQSHGSATPKKHVLVTANNGVGTRWGFYAPHAYITGERPTIVNWRGLPYQQATYALTEGPDTTNDLTRSFLRFFRS